MEQNGTGPWQILKTLFFEREQILETEAKERSRQRR
jgi:hypothetical protein